jgi:hypothetical protein
MDQFTKFSAVACLVTASFSGCHRDEEFSSEHTLSPVPALEVDDLLEHHSISPQEHAILPFVVNEVNSASSNEIRHSYQHPQYLEEFGQLPGATTYSVTKKNDHGRIVISAERDEMIGSYMVRLNERSTTHGGSSAATIDDLPAQKIFQHLEQKFEVKAERERQRKELAKKELAELSRDWKAYLEHKSEFPIEAGSWSQTANHPLAIYSATFGNITLSLYEDTEPGPGGVTLKTYGCSLGHVDGGMEFFDETPREQWQIKRAIDRVKEELAEER